MTEEDSRYQAALLPDNPVPARLIVLERTGRWATALVRELPDMASLLDQTRSLSDCSTALRRAPASFLVLEVRRANWSVIAERLLWLPRDFPLAHAALVSDRKLGAWLGRLRTPGIVDLVTSPRRIAPLAWAVRRHIACIHPPQQPLAQRVWAELPWGAT